MNRTSLVESVVTATRLAAAAVTLAVFTPDTGAAQEGGYQTGDSPQGVSLQDQGAGWVAIKGSWLDVDVAGNIYVVNRDRATMTLLDRSLAVRAEVGGPGWEPGTFDLPGGVWARNGLDIYVADYGNHRIQRFDRTLSFVSEFRTRDEENADIRFGYPADVALSRLGELYICDTENIRVLKIDPKTQSSTTFGGIGGGKGRLSRPGALQIGPRDNLYVLDGSRIVVFDPFGNFLRELYSSLFTSPSAIFADEVRLLVLQGDSLYCLDANERILPVLPVESVKGTQGSSLRSIAFGRGTLFLLVEERLVALPDPWRSGEANPGSVDTEGKNR